ncbi:MAG TPA: hypothetical protein VMT99_01415 [Candidatus Paceibacterota bacterium]|nr:hypothetical protein [Candidatus Paceibacterota bacterium]
MIIFVLLFAANIVNPQKLSFSMAVIAWVIVVIIHFFLTLWANRARQRNFYFQCDDQKLEIHTGLSGKKIIEIPYGEIAKIWANRPQIGAARAPAQGVGFSLGYFSIFVQKEHQWPRTYGGFTQDDAQKIVDFVQQRIGR